MILLLNYIIFIFQGLFEVTLLRLESYSNHNLTHLLSYLRTPLALLTPKVGGWKTPINDDP